MRTNYIYPLQFAKYIAQREHISRADAIKIVKIFIRNMHQVLLDKKRLVIPKIASFEQCTREYHNPFQFTKGGEARVVSTNIRAFTSNRIKKEFKQQRAA